MDPSGFKYRTEQEFHVDVFTRIKNLLHPDIPLGLCKEDASMWQEIGAEWQGCHCLHGTADRVTEGRLQVLNEP
jgi:hypothetical protein